MHTVSLQVQDGLQSNFLFFARRWNHSRRHARKQQKWRKVDNLVPRGAWLHSPKKKATGSGNENLSPCAVRKLAHDSLPAQFSLHKSVTSKMRRSNVLFVLERRIKRLGRI